jgi:hypothetical protein
MKSAQGRGSMKTTGECVGLVTRLKNRRVTLWDLGDGYAIEFKRIVGSDGSLETARMNHWKRGRRVVLRTNLSLSEETLGVLVQMYLKMLGTKAAGVTPVYTLAAGKGVDHADAKGRAGVAEREVPPVRETDPR